MAWTTAAEAAPSHTKIATSAYKTQESSYRTNNNEQSHLNGGGPGWWGERGPRGWPGLRGWTGPRGAAGPQGPRGTTGSTGPRGATGPQGVAGSQGPQGIIGPQGSQGIIGPQGPQGVIGPQGPAGSSQYGYVYNQSAQVVAIESDVTFSTNGILTGGITHAAGNATIGITNAGDYKVTFSVTGVEPSQFALFVNGVPVTGAIYGSGAGTQQNNGQVFVTLAAGDILTLRNHSSAAAVTLQTLAGGTQTNVNASIAIEKLS